MNASGKTSLLKVISFVIEFINDESINNISNKDILRDSENVEIIAYFFDPKNGVCKLESEISRTKDNKIESRYIINDERLWVKKKSKVKTKQDLFKFNSDQLAKKRDNKAEFLKDDTSIILSINRNQRFYLKDLIKLTNVNLLRLIGNFPHELIAFLDPNIENISFDKNTGEAKLKFYGR
ncbi:AAA family ATPase [Amygdalobacter nucleatus]|uniref:AAA family ATPase n=1 Tax=Amygdalobacter nucleatus TaxID=3029274 RepID=UPI0028F142A4|nr:AAA family ATPase [Amygdalobacter nucleatus]